MAHGAMKGWKAGVRRAFQLLSVCFFLFPTWMTALDPAHRISQYGHSSWKIQDGYFGSQPVSIAQTTGGYLWVETGGGLFRFDGMQFVSWTSLTGEKLPSPDYWPMLGARDGIRAGMATQAALNGSSERGIAKYHPSPFATRAAAVHPAG